MADLEKIDFDALEDEGMSLDDEDNFIPENDDEEEQEDEGIDSEEDSDEDEGDDSEEGNEDSEEENNQDDEDEDEDEEGDEDDDEEGDSQIYSQISQRFGIEIEDFEPTSEDPIENLVSYSQRLVEQLVNKKVDDYKNTNPVTKDFLEYLENGGDPNKFIDVLSPEINYLDIKKIDDNEDLQRQLVIKDLTDKGVSKKDALDMVDAYSSSGMLQKQAEIALKVGKDQQEQAKEKLLREQEAEKETLSRLYKEETQRYTNIIKTSPNIKGIPIPEAEKDDFIKFITRNEEGVSPYLERVKEGFSDEEILVIQRIAHMGFDLSKLIQTEVKNRKAKDLKSLLNNQKKKESSSKSGTNKSQATVDDIVFSD